MLVGKLSDEGCCIAIIILTPVALPRCEIVRKSSLTLFFCLLSNSAINEPNSSIIKKNGLKPTSVKSTSINSGYSSSKIVSRLFISL